MYNNDRRLTTSGQMLLRQESKCRRQGPMSWGAHHQRRRTAVTSALRAMRGCENRILISWSDMEKNLPSDSQGQSIYLTHFITGNGMAKLRYDLPR